MGRPIIRLVALIVVLSAVACTGANPVEPAANPALQPPPGSINSITIVSVTPESGSVTQPICNDSVGNGRKPECPTVDVIGTLQSGYDNSHADFMMVTCLSDDPVLIPGGCIAKSVQSGNVESIRPLLPRDGVRYVVVFIYDDTDRKDLLPYRQADGRYAVTPESPRILAHKVQPHTIYLPK